MYAVGAVLFEMLTGRTAFRGDSAVAVALAQQLHPAPDVREFRADVPPALAGIVAPALARLPADRYATAAEMGSALAVRSGDTAIMPSARIGMTDPEPLLSPAPPHRSRVLIAIVAIALAVLVLVVVMRSGDERSSGTSSITTVAPATVAATALIVDEIIPGFRRTDDLVTFLRQIENDKALVGPAAAELAAELDRLLPGNSAHKQRDRAEALISRVQVWVDAEQLDPAIAQALTELLAPLAGKSKP